MKKYSFAAFCCTLFSFAIAQHNIPIVQNIFARPHISLNGQWNYIIDPLENGYYDYRLMPSPTGFFENRKPASPADLVEYDFDSASKMNIPGDWNSQDERLFVYEGTVWFQRYFDISKETGKRYILYFGAVNYEAKVWVNGKKAGEHTGGYTPFNFDITSLLQNGKNFVVVKVDNKRQRDNVPTLNMDWWNYGGITRDVLLATLPENYIEDYSICLGKQSGLIEGWVKCNTATTGLAVTLEIPELKIKQQLHTGDSARIAFQIKAKPQLWSPQNPKLYDIQFTTDNEKVTDRVGFRTVVADGKKILLNGKHTFLRGISIHEEAPFRSGRAWSREDARTLLSWAKEMNCNYVRLAHYPHNENMTRMADEMGLLVWSEIPVYWTISFDNPATYQNAAAQLHDMIARDKNRASIVIWSIANETPHSDARDTFLANLAQYARSLDNTRLLSMAMEVTAAQNNVNRLNDNMNRYVDVISFNEYIGWYRDKVESCKDMTWEIPYNKPVIISEFGGGALQGMHGDKTHRWTEEYQAELYRENLAMMNRIDGFSGVSPWILVDFRSPRRQLPHIQDFFNRKGLISNHGIRKQAFYVMQEFYSQKLAEFEK